MIDLAIITARLARNSVKEQFAGPRFAAQR
jgi:hypothetical protein